MKPALRRLWGKVVTRRTNVTRLSQEDGDTERTLNQLDMNLWTGSSRCWTHPVHDEDLPHAQPLLQQPGCYGNRVEVAEAPARGQERGEGGEFGWRKRWTQELKQTHMGELSSAWCPGGRTTAKPFCQEGENSSKAQTASGDITHTHTHTVLCGPFRAALLMWGPLGPPVSDQTDVSADAD